MQIEGKMLSKCAVDYALLEAIWGHYKDMTLSFAVSTSLINRELG